MVANGSVPSHMEEIAQLPSLHSSFLPQRGTHLSVGTNRMVLANTWFTDGSSTTDGTKANGKRQAYRTEMKWPVLRKETQNRGSAIGYKTNN